MAAHDHPRDRSTRPKLVVIGQGYVGLPLALRAAEVGYRVVGFDLDGARIKHLEAGESPVGDIDDARLGAALDAGTYLPTVDPAELVDFDVAVISVPTPLNGGNPDLSHITAAATQLLGAALRPGPPWCWSPPPTRAPPPSWWGRCWRTARAWWPAPTSTWATAPSASTRATRSGTSRTPPRWCRASTSRRWPRWPASTTGWSSRTVPVSSPAEAELTKLLENTFRHVNIALVNELAMYAHDLGIDVWEAIDAASTKPFGYLRFTPGPGVGGHCLPVDPSYLSWRVRQSLGVPFRFVELANDVNAHMPDYVVRRLTLALNQRHLSVNGQRILLLGLAYKRNTSDARETPSRPIAEQLVELGAEVLVADPHTDDRALPDGVRRVEPTPERGGVRGRHRAAGGPRRLRPGRHRRGRALPARHPPPGRGSPGRAPLIGRSRRRVSRDGGGCRTTTRPGTTPPPCPRAAATGGTTR